MWVNVRHSFLPIQIDSCGHARCYQCLFDSEKCALCEAEVLGGGEESKVALVAPANGVNNGGEGEREMERRKVGVLMNMQHACTGGMLKM